MLAVVVLLVGLLALPACARAEQAANAATQAGEAELPPKRLSSLTGTAWRLVGYDSFETGADRARPAVGEEYFLAFQPGGVVELKLACRSGTARWQANQGEADRGSLSIRGLTVTRTACPGARMTRIADDLDSVGSYVLGPGDVLTLNLRADSGNLVWERIKDEP